MERAEKIRENRLRRMAERQGFALQKSRRRDPRAYDYGTYMLTDPNTNSIVAAGDVGRGYGLTLDDIEEWLVGPEGSHAPLGSKPGRGRPLPSLGDLQLAQRRKARRVVEEALERRRNK
jgi:hypothetical protein